MSAPVSAIPGQPTLGLADLEEMALRNNPTIPAAEALVRQEQGLWRQVGLYPNPTFGYVRTDPNKPGQSETQGLFFSQDIVTAGKRRLARAVDAQEIQWRKWQLDAQRGRVQNDVRIRYYEVLGAQEAVWAARDMERLAVEGVDSVKALLKANQGSRPDLLQAEIQLNTVRTTLQDAQYRHQAAWQQLANVIGTPDMPPVLLAGSLEEDIPDLGWQESLQRLLSASPVLKAQEAQIRAAAGEIRLARAQAIPNLNVQVVAQHDQVLKYDSVTSLVSLPIPFFNRNQGNIQQAIGQLQQQQKEYQRVQLALADQLAVSFQQYRSARSQAERLRKEILPRAKESLELTIKGHKAGQFDFLRVQNARQTYFETNLAYLDALTALHKVAIEISGLELTGGLNPTEVGTALQTQPGAAGPAGVRHVLLQQLQQESRMGSTNLPGAIQAGPR